MPAHVELQASRRTQGDAPVCRQAVTATGASSRAAYSSTIQLSCRGSASARHRLTHPADRVASQIGVDDMLEAPTCDCGAHGDASASRCWWYRRSRQNVKMNKVPNDCCALDPFGCRCAKNRFESRPVSTDNEVLKRVAWPEARSGRSLAFAAGRRPLGTPARGDRATPRPERCAAIAVAGAYRTVRRHLQWEGTAM